MLNQAEQSAGFLERSKPITIPHSTQLDSDRQTFILFTLRELFLKSAIDHVCKAVFGLGKSNIRIRRVSNLKLRLVKLLGGGGEDREHSEKEKQQHDGASSLAHSGRCWRRRVSHSGEIRCRQSRNSRQ